MHLSEAILYGRTLRPESHQEGWPFVRVANTDELRSDVWGAAVEAVHSPITQRSWTEATRQADMAYFCDIQRQHFGNYFRTPANCPGAQPREALGQHAPRKTTGNTYSVKYEEQIRIGPVTSDCKLILSLAEFVEHAFYIHNWSSDDCAQAVAYYEQGQQILVAQSFDHYQSETVRSRVSQKLTAVAWRRELQRRARRTGNRVYAH